MERTQLSASLASEKFGILCVPFVVLIAMSNYRLNFAVVVATIIIFGLFGLLFYLLLRIKTIEFDDNFVYFSIDNKEEMVPLENIQFIKLTTGGINKKDFWKMKYLSVNNEEKSLTFVPKIWLKELFKLQELVKEKNPNAIIENSATSLDIN